MANLKQKTTVITTVEYLDAASLLDAKLLPPDGNSKINLAVELILKDASGQVLLMRRGKGCRDEVGLLEGIGGRVEAGETFRQALNREIAEELGTEINVSSIQFSHFRCQYFREADSFEPRRWFVASYRGLWASGVPIIVEPDKCSEILVRSVSSLMQHELAASTQFLLAQNFLL